MFSFQCEKCCLTHCFNYSKADKGKIVMFLNLHVPNNSHLTTYIDCHHHHFCAHERMQFSYLLRVTFLSTWLVTHSEEVRSVIPLHRVTSDPPLADHVIPQGEPTEKTTYQTFDLYVTFSLEDFPFCLEAGRTKTDQQLEKKKKRADRQWFITPLQEKWVEESCSRPLLFPEHAANMGSLMRVTYMHTFP